MLLGAFNAQADVDRIARLWVEHNKAELAAKTVTVEQVASARSWAQLNAQLNSASLNNVLGQVYGSGWAYGTNDAAHELGLEIADPWANWHAGNEGAAALVDAPKGLTTLLESRGVTIDGMNNVTMDRLGSALAEALSQGLGIEQTASIVNQVFDNPARAMIVARTETARALVQANIDQYRAENVGSLEWLVGDPCDICAENDGVIVAIGDEFPSGDEYPPAHPNCVCDVAPVNE